jgi:hypothetical protein
VPSALSLPVDKHEDTDAVKGVLHLVRAQQGRNEVLVGDADVARVWVVPVADCLHTSESVSGCLSNPTNYMQYLPLCHHASWGLNQLGVEPPAVRGLRTEGCLICSITLALGY